MIKITRLFDQISQFLILLLLFIVAFNIIARQIHDISDGYMRFMLPGAIELSRYTLLLIVFAALPRAATQGMVRVDFLSKKLPLLWQHRLNKLWLLLMAGFTGLLTWLTINKAWLTYHRGDATQDLQLPLFYFYVLISLATFATTLSCLQLLIHSTPQSSQD